MGKLEPSFIFGENVKWCSCFWNMSVVPSKVNHVVTIWYSTFTLKKIQNICSHKICKQKFRVAWFTIAKESNQIYQWIDKMCYFCTMEYNSVLKRNEMWMHYDMNEPWKHHTKWNKPLTKDHILYNSIC